MNKEKGIAICAVTLCFAYLAHEIKGIKDRMDYFAEHTSMYGYHDYSEKFITNTLDYKLKHLYVEDVVKAVIHKINEKEDANG